MNRITVAFCLLVAFSFGAFVITAQTPPRKSIAAVTEKMKRIDGFVPLYISADDGKIYIEVTRFGTEFLYLVSLPTGVGSNPLGLDRGQLGTTKIVTFERAGNKVLLVQPNYDFRATGDAKQKKSVEESFAKSVIWGFKVEAADGERVLIDATSFLIRDAHGVGDRLNQAKQGNYSFDESRSALYMPNTKGFPKNTEVEATVTLSTTAETGNLINQVAPTGRNVTVRERHSFVELPDDKYRPRRFDPRTGSIPISFYDYGTDINEDLEKRWILRHRLEKKDPSAAISEPVKPIVYYVDNGAPKAIQDALIEGASWWNQAFEAAGFRNAFHVRVLPPDADPMDVRYNVVNWVHRATRGWSIGDSVVDPRTGEIIKGDVTLDSQRARQDFLLGTGMAPQYASASNACDFGLLPDVDYLASTDAASDVTAMSYARIRQLSAHEVGHTLGFTHNFAASTYGRGSVMDYPAPLVEIRDGKLDLSNAYAVGIGAFDKFAVTYAYSQFSAGANESFELEKIVREGVAAGMLFLSDNDARPAGGSNPLANLWDNGADPVAMLRHEMKVRRIGLNQFGIQNIEKGAPLSELENKFLPLYLHHRYQLNAAIKSIGGSYYTFAVRTENGPNPATVTENVPAARQRDALAAALETIKPDELAIPDNILRLMPPIAYGYGSGRSELFAKRTNPMFDAVGAAEIAADLAISGLLEPNRAARSISQNARDRAYPSFREVVGALVKTAFASPASADGNQALIQRAVQSLLAERLMELAANPNAQSQVRATAAEALRSLLAMLKRKAATGDTAAHYRSIAEDIERFLKRPDAPRKQPAPLPNPPGDPIGGN
ncbi:MAG TPA: zinc-dependent metalloprotease [Pyrinomonadaceae bacterium]|nr:zinc-dependent metalloprotease [Chloracidobacterium sp.]MBL0241611.1 zinc-dependent metalloprotease [Chloracidobacterium sp.]HQY65682.1 zinc-dependent metalloprotease [Pyrinomonadaceae bacterium]HRA41118.1 zinc-dependent metalloprotease [Pyrinomonadaceae bacterium]